jgi:hypothetical protein
MLTVSAPPTFLTRKTLSKTSKQQKTFQRMTATFHLDRVAKTVKQVIVIIFSSTVLFVQCGCATIFGGSISYCQKSTPPKDQPQRQIRPVPLAIDIALCVVAFPIPLAIDFITGAIYIPCEYLTPKEQKQIYTHVNQRHHVNDSLRYSDRYPTPPYAQNQHEEDITQLLNHNKDVLVIGLKQIVPKGSQFVANFNSNPSVSFNCDSSATMDRAKNKTKRIGGNIIKITKYKEPRMSGSACCKIKASIFFNDSIKIAGNNKNVEKTSTYSFVSRQETQKELQKELQKESQRKATETRKKIRLTKVDTCKSLSISVCATEMLYGYEALYLNYKFSKHFLAGVGGGHIFQFKNEGSFSNNEAEQPLLAYNGTVVRGYLYFFPFKYSSFYIGALAAYKDLNYNHYNFWQAHYTGDHSLSFERSETAAQYGASLIIGSHQKFLERGTLEYYIGIGNSYRTRTYTTYGFWSPYFPQEMGNAYGVGKTITENQSFTTFQLGIKIGFFLYKKH